MNETTRESESEPKPKTLIRKRKNLSKTLTTTSRLIEAPQKKKRARMWGTDHSSPGPPAHYRSFSVSNRHGDGSITAVDPTSTNGNIAVMGTLPRVSLVAEGTQVLEYVGA
jgi:hypothetical protein